MLRLVLVAMLVLAGVVQAADAPKVTFADHVLPIFRNACLNCHNPDKKKAGLDLTSYGATMAGGDSSKAIVPGDPDGSLVYKLVTHQEEPKMPQRGDKLPQKDLDIIKKWIEGGALENSGSKASVSAKPKVDLAVVTKVGKPDGPPPMPKVELPQDPVVRTNRPGALLSLASSPWAPLIAIGGQKQVLLYQSETRELIGVLPFPEGMPHVLKFSQNGSLLLVGGGQGAKLGKVIVHEIATGKRIAEVGDEFDAVLAADISPDQTQVVLGGPLRMVRVYSTADGQVLHSIKKHTDWVTAIACSPDGKFFATADRAGGLWVWDAKDAQEYYNLAGHRGPVTDIAFRGDSKLLASSSEDGTIKLWNLDAGTQLKSWNAHGGGAMSVEFAHDGRIVSAGRDKVIKTWTADGNAVKQLEAFPDIALHATFDHEGKNVIGGDWSGQVKVWTAEGKGVGELAINPLPMAERVAAVEKKVGELQKAAEQASASAKAAQDAANKASAELAAAQKDVAEKQIALDTAKGAIPAAENEIKTLTAAIEQIDKNAPKLQETAQKLGASVSEAANNANAVADKLKQASELIAQKQKELEAASKAAMAAAAEGEKKPEDKALADAFEKAIAQAKNVAGELEDAKASLARRTARSAQAAEILKKVQGDSTNAANAIAAAKADREAKAKGIEAAKGKAKAAGDSVAALTAAVEAAKKAAAEKEKVAKAAGEAAGKAKAEEAATAAGLAAAKEELNRLKTKLANKAAPVAKAGT